MGVLFRKSQEPRGCDRETEKLNQCSVEEGGVEGGGGGNWRAADVHVMLFACFSRKDNGHYRRQRMPINKAGSMEGNIDKGRGGVGVH